MSADTQQARGADTEHEGWAVGWLTLGLVLGPLGATIGAYLALRSTRWSARWKAAALATPVVLVVIARTTPSESELSFATFSVGLLAAVVAATYVLKRAASRGSGHPRLPWFTALPIAILSVAVASSQLERLHSIGSYDYHDDVVAAARSADAAGESYGVVTESFFDGVDEHTIATVKRLAGPGNARFVAIFDELEAKHGGFATSKLSPQELGTCYVFPVVTSRREGIESVTSLARQCTGVSEAGSSVSLSNR